MVQGEGSLLATDDWLYVGNSGRGTLRVADGGKVTAGRVSVNSQSAARLHVSDDGMWETGNMTNNGTVAFYADALLPAGTYRPLAVPGVWSGTGAYTAVGGTWSTVDKTFTVSAATALSAGASDTVVSGERLLITDSASSDRVGASFGTIAGSVSFSATPLTGEKVDDLGALLPSGEHVLGAWDFITNYSGGSEVLLSFDVGPGFGDLFIWHLQGNVWQPYEPTLLSYDATGLASFTVDSFSAYAVATGVPEPVAPLLMTAAAGAWLRRRR